MARHDDCAPAGPLSCASNDTMNETGSDELLLVGHRPAAGARRGDRAWGLADAPAPPAVPGRFSAPAGTASSCARAAAASTDPGPTHRADGRSSRASVRPWQLHLPRNSPLPASRLHAGAPMHATPAPAVAAG